MLNAPLGEAINIMKTTGTLLAALLLASTTPVLAEQFYKWVDDQGVTHYDSKPPQGQRPSEAVRTYGKASSDQAAELERLEQRRQANARADQQASEQARQEARERAHPDQVRQERCAEQRKNLDLLTNRPTLRIKNPDTGAMEVIDQARREKMLADTRKALEFCDASGS
tara:strand:+ start:9155 stop:9661 length:507 start_codon:yes stop_codon:yes gene_type:complete